MRESGRGGGASCSPLLMPNNYQTTTLQPLGESRIWERICLGECTTSRERCAPLFEHMLLTNYTCH